jgi:hypothetical protein
VLACTASLNFSAGALWRMGLCHEPACVSVQTFELL